MLLTVEKKHPTDNPSEKKVTDTVLSLRSYGPASFAALTAPDGSYVQVAGGVVTCMLERRDGKTGRHYRAYGNEPSKVFSDGTELVFGGGRVKLNSNEWFDNKKAAELFVSFLSGKHDIEGINWRDVSEIFS